MKFVTSSLGKKLIVVLVILLLFNVIYPSMTFAVDLGGILLQPLYWLLLGIYIPIDLAIGSVIRMSDFDWDDINDYSEDVMQTKPEDWDGVKSAVGSQLASLFIGPDSIFKRRY